MNTQKIKISEIRENPDNPRIIKDEKFKKLVKSIKEFPQMLELRPIVVDDNMVVLGGNMRLKALKELGYKEVPIIKASDLTDEQKKEFIIKDNVWYGEWDWDVLANEWDNSLLNNWGLDIAYVETDEEKRELDVQAKLEKKDGILNEYFVVPPFSILDSRAGYWQDRKKRWLEIIGDNWESRNKTLFSSPQMQYPRLYRKYWDVRKEWWYKNFNDFLSQFSKEELEKETKAMSNWVSILDPVLSEVMVRWFCPSKWICIDPFAGDSVFGCVAGTLGRRFTGVEIRQEQCNLNQRRADELKIEASYICDDGQNIWNHIDENSVDMIFSCPPYFDLEKYSDNPLDASNQSNYQDFLKILDNAFTSSIKCLRENRFAVVVMSNVRWDNWAYYRICDDIKDIFEKNWMCFYNDLVLINIVGTTALRASGYMRSLKIGRSHQNVMVFYKWDTDNMLFDDFENSRENVNMHTDVMVFYKWNPSEVWKNFNINDIKNESKNI